MRLVGVGIDVVEVARVERLLDRHGDRFANRWFTPAEVAWARVDGCPARGLSAVLAGKEAVWKALPVQPDGPVPWRSLQVLPEGGTGGQVTLPAGLAPEATTFHLSIGGEPRRVVAWVLAFIPGAAAAAAPAHRRQPAP